MTKKCSGCKQILSIAEFNRRAASKDGLRGRCRSCEKAADKKWYWSNLEKKSGIQKRNF